MREKARRPRRGSPGRPMSSASLRRKDDESVKRTLLRKGLALSTVLGIAAALLLVISPGAEAAPPAGTKIITVVGSDTTEDVVEAALTNPDPNGAGDNGL